MERMRIRKAEIRLDSGSVRHIHASIHHQNGELFSSLGRGRSFEGGLKYELKGGVYLTLWSWDINHYDEKEDDVV